MSEQPNNQEIDRQELDQLLGALCNETITRAEHDRLQEMLLQDSNARQHYFQYLDLHLELEQFYGVSLPSALEQTGETELKPISPRRPFVSLFKRKIYYGFAGVVLAAVLTVALGLFDFSPHSNQNNPGQSITQSSPFATVTQTSQVHFVAGTPSLQVRSEFKEKKKYALTEGELQLTFFNGAQVILKGPAVFEVQGPTSLLVNYGECSVYAPEGAEGFEVKTPVSHVIDLGTRFSINVNESGQTDVQIIEGEAEVHPVNSLHSPKQQTISLTKGMAKRYTHDQKNIAQDIPYRHNSYSSQLPDRVVQYQATQGAHGGVENLTSVTVQRGGKKYQYDVDQLIGIEVIHFKGVSEGRGYFTTGIDHDDPLENHPLVKSRKGLLDADASLVTGLINPGGSEIPLTTDPVINNPETGTPNTPGMAIRFHSPVINGPGPDMILFDLHVIVHPVYGDQFHVSPLRFRPGLHSHTVQKFDINLLSAESKMIDKFQLYTFDQTVSSLDQLESFSHNEGMVHVVDAKAIVTGIDFSDLGYNEGEKIESLFIQDAMEKTMRLDPVFIAGFPETP